VHFPNRVHAEAAKNEPLSSWRIIKHGSNRASLQITLVGVPNRPGQSLIRDARFQLDSYASTLFWLAPIEIGGQPLCTLDAR
jgi:hypothetical protein